MQNSKRMSETRYWMFSRGTKGSNRKKSRLRRIGLRIRSTRWPVEVRLGSLTRISWTRVRRHSTIVDQSATLTDNAAVDLFQQHILGQGSQVRQTGARSRTPNLTVIHRATSLLLSSSKTNKLPMRLGWPSSLPPVTNSTKRSRLHGDFNHPTHKYPLYVHL